MNELSPELKEIMYGTLTIADCKSFTLGGNVSLKRGSLKQQPLHKRNVMNELH